MNLLRFIGLIALCAITSTASAQYPARAVKIIVPFGGGGTADLVARITAQKLVERTGKSFVVENKTGAGGRIGYEAAAKSPGDGYTLVAAELSYTMLPALYGTLGWDQANDLVPIIIAAQTHAVMVVGPEARFKSLKDVVEQAKANPGKLNFGSVGIGTNSHIVTEMFMRDAQIRLTHVPYKGMGDATTGLLNGSIDLLITALPGAIGQIKGGKIVPLAVSSAKRTPAIPNVPTFTESGVPLLNSNWYGFMAPKGTPKAVIDYLHQQVARAVESADVKEILAAQGAEVYGAVTPEEFSRIVRDETKRWGDVIRAAGIKGE